MAIGGICDGCRQYAHGLLTCKTCHAHVCPMCYKGMFCRICEGRRMTQQ